MLLRRQEVLEMQGDLHQTKLGKNHAFPIVQSLQFF